MAKTDKPAKRAGPGRPPKLNAEVTAKVVEALRGGNFRIAAAAWAGIGYRTFHEWMLKGEAEPNSEHGEFRRAVVQAEKAAEIRAVALIMQAAAEDPKHAEWWLSHRYPERWADKHRLEARVASTVTIAINGVAAGVS